MKRPLISHLALIATLTATTSPTLPAHAAPAHRRPVLVSGIVLDTARRPVAGAEVALVDDGRTLDIVRTLPDGRFTLEVLTPATSLLRVRQLGFASRTVRLSADGAGAPLTIVLERVAQSLDTVRVADVAGIDRGLAEFTARATSNRFGHFINEDAVDAMHATLASDILRHVPGITVRPARGYGNLVRIRGCAPLVWVDGQRARGAEVDDVAPAHDVAAMEVYNSVAGVPAQYADRSATCGTVLVWLRTR